MESMQGVPRSATRHTMPAFQRALEECFAVYAIRDAPELQREAEAHLAHFAEGVCSQGMSCRLQKQAMMLKLLDGRSQPPMLLMLCSQFSQLGRLASPSRRQTWNRPEKCS